MTEKVSPGYSGTPLPLKLGLRDGQAALFVGLPEPLSWLLHAAAFASAARADDWRAIGERSGLDFIHAFFIKTLDLGGAVPFIRKSLKPTGMAWVSWPKRAAKVPTDITEDVIRQIALPAGLVDVKVAAVDETWSGLKLVIRKELRNS
jgi:hypothetical protein